MTRRAVLISRILLAVYLVTVFILCFGKFEAGPDFRMTIWGIPTDKVVHFSMFLPFPILLFCSLNGFRLGRPQRWIALLCIIAAGLLTATATEAAQHFIPYRTGDWKDLAADSIGIMTSSLILAIVLCLKD